MSANNRSYSIDAPDQQRLKVARAEIEAVLKKYDLGGAAVLHTPGMAEFFYDLQPSYSCAWIDDKRAMVRVKSLGTDYGGDRQAQLHDQAATANLLHSLADNLVSAAAMFTEVASIFDRLTRAVHTAPSHVAAPLEAKRH